MALADYIAARDAPVPKPQTIVVITLDSCSLTYSVGACTASAGVGNECYNTLDTCQDVANYDKTTKEYRFSSHNRPLPLPGENIRPYLLEEPNTLPTEIDPLGGAKIVKNAKVTLKFADEPDNDVGVDPYVANRAYAPEDQGTFWRKWLARNIYTLGRTVVIKHGYQGLAEADYEHMKQKYVIEGIKGPDRKGVVSIVLKDPLKRADRVKVPVETDGELANNHTDSFPTLTFSADTNMAQYPTSGYERIDDEIIHHTGKSGQTLTGCTHAHLGTTAASHDQDTVVQLCYVKESINVWEIIEDILVNEVDFTEDTGTASSGTPTTLVDNTKAWVPDAFIVANVVIYEGTGAGQAREITDNDATSVTVATWDTDPDATSKYYIAFIDVVGAEAEVDRALQAFTFTGVVSEPTKASDLLTELTEQSMSYLFWDEEAQTIRFKAFFLPSPDDSIADLNETEHLAELVVDNNEKSRITRTVVHYEKSAVGELKKKESYARSYIVTDEDAAGDEQYGSHVTKTIFSRWINSATLARRLGTVWRNRFRDPAKKVTFAVALKDSDIKIADIVELTSDRIVNPDGTARQSRRYQVLKKKQASPAKYVFDVLDSGWGGLKYGNIAPTGTPDFGAASEEQKQDYVFISAGTPPVMGDGTDSYAIF